MPRLTFVAAVLIVLSAGVVGAQSWYSTDWPYRQKITISANLATATLTDFPLLVQITGPDALFSLAQSNGNDILFTAADGVTKLDHEIELYDPSGGSEELDVWVRVPSIDSAVATTIYLYYGNAGASNQENPTGVWDDDFAGVWHMNDQVTDEESSGLHLDSTANNQDGSQFNNAYVPPSGTTKIAGAQYLDGKTDPTGDLINVDNVVSDSWTGLTESGWARVKDFDTSFSDPRIISKSDSGEVPETTIFSLTIDDQGVDTGRMRVRLRTDIGGVPQDYGQFFGSIVMNEETWYHAAFTWDAATDAWVIYLNGAVDISGTKTGDDIADGTSNHDLIIGNVSIDSERWFYGQLDEIRVSKAARSQAWIFAEYRNQNDPATDLTFTEEVQVSGTVYSDAGLTPLGDGRTVSLSINGGAAIPPGGTTASDGSYAIVVPTASLNVGDRLTVYLDDNAERGSVITVSDGGQLTGLDLYQDHVIVRHDNGGTMTNPLLSGTDNLDDDLDHTVAAGALTVGNENEVTLYVPSGHTFDPGGDVTVGDPELSNLRVEGTMNAAGTLSVRGDATGGGMLSGGTATVDLQKDITISTYNATTGTTTVSGNWTVGAFTPNGGTVDFTGTGSTAVSTFDNLTISSGTRTATGPWTVNTSFMLSGGTFDPGSYSHQIAGAWNDSAVTFMPTAGTIVLFSAAAPSITQDGANNFFDLTLNNGASLAGALDVNGDLTVNGSPLTTNDNNITLCGSWTNLGGFVPGSGTVTLDGAATIGAINGSNTFTNLSITTPGKVVKFGAGATQTVTGTFTVTGVSGGRVQLESDTPGIRWIIDAGTTGVTFASVSDSTSSPGTITADESIDGGNNLDWIFNPISGFVWTGATSSDWSVTTNWSGGVVPGAGDTAVIPPGRSVYPVLTGATPVGTLNIDVGASLDTAGFTLTINTAFNNLGTLYRRGGDSVSRMDTDSGTVVYRGAGGTIQDHDSGGDDYYDLVIDGPGLTFLGSGAGEMQTANNLTVLGGFLDSAGSQIDVQDGSLTVATGARVLASGGALDVNAYVAGGITGGGIVDGGSATVFSGGTMDVATYLGTTGTTRVEGDWGVSFYTHNGGEMRFEQDASIDTPTTFSSVQILSGTRSLAADVTIESTLTIETDAILSVGAYNLSATRNDPEKSPTVYEVTGAGTLILGSGTVDIDGDIDVSTYTVTTGDTFVAGNWSVLTFDPGVGKVIFDNQGFLEIASPVFYDLTIAAGAFLDTLGQGAVINGTFENQGTLWRQGTSFENFSKTDLDSGKVSYYGTASTIQDYGAIDYFDLEIFQAMNLGADVRVVNDLILVSSLNAAGFDVTLGGDWSNATGTFTPGAGSVIFNNAAVVSLISGTTTFNNLVVTIPGKKLRFTAGTTQTVTNLTVTGAFDSLVILESTLPGSPWLLNTTTSSVDYVAVQDSNAGTPITATGSIDGGNNFGWTFAGRVFTWIGGSNDFSLPANWDLGELPLNNDSIIIAAGTPNDPVLTANVTIRDAVIMPGATLDTAGFSLDIAGAFDNQGILYRRGGDSVSQMDTDSGTVWYRTTGGLIQDYGSTDYHDLILQGAAFTLDRAITTAGDFTLAAGASLDTVNKTMTVGGDWDGSGTFNFGSGTVYFNDSSKITTVSGSTTFNNLSIIEPGKIVRFTSGTTQTITAGGQFLVQGKSGSYVTLESTTGGSLWTVNAANSDVDFAYVSDSDATANPITAGSSIDGGGNTDWTFTNPATLKTWTGATSSVWSTGSNWDGALAPAPGDSIVIPSSAPNWPVLDVASISLTNLTILAGGELDTGGNDLVISGTLNNEGVLFRQGGDTVTRKDIDSGTVIYRTAGGAIQNYGDTEPDYYALQIQDASFSASGDLWVAADLTLSAGATLSLGVYDLRVQGSVSGAGTLSGSSGMVEVDGAMTVANFAAPSGLVTVAGDWSVGSFNHGGGAVKFDGSGSITTATTFDDLEVAVGTRTLAAKITVEGDLLITAGTLDAAGFGIGVEGGWSNSGSFVAGGNTVTIQDAAQPSAIAGQTTFFNFSLATPGKTLRFEEGKTQTVSGLLTVQGSFSNKVVLESSFGGGQWSIDAAGADVDYASVQDSNALTPITAYNSVNVSGNVNWTFLNEVSIIARQTEDSDGNGFIDRILMTADSDLNDDFTDLTAVVTGYGFSSFTTGAPTDQFFYINLVEGGTPDTGATPDVRITANTSLKDFPAPNVNVAVDFTAVAATDTAEPVITASETGDLDGDGFIDAVRVRFSEPVSDSTVSAVYFAISGATGLVFSSTTAGDVANDDDIYITFTDGVQSTASTPTLTYTPGTIADLLLSNAAPAFGPTVALDRAGPAIVLATASLGATSLQVTFSEPVYTTTGGIGLLVAGDFVYDDIAAGGATAVASLAEADGSDSVVTLTTDAVVAVADIATDTVAAAPTDIYDAADNAAAATAVTFDDTIGPQLVSVTLADAPNPGAGAGDTIALVYNEAISAASLTSPLIGGNTNNTLAAGSGNITGALADIIAELGSFATATTATADATTLTLSADGTMVTIILAGTVADGVFPAGVFTPAASYTDLSANTVDTAVTQTATGTWDGTKPQLVSVTLGDAPNPGAGAGDTIALVYNEAISAASLTSPLIGGNTNNTLAAGSGNITGALADIIAELGSFATATTATADATTLELSADGTTVIITLAGTVADGVFPAGVFTPDATYTDLSANTVDIAVTQTATGTWDGTAPQLVSVTLADAPNPGAGAGDTITLVYNEALSPTSISTALVGGNTNNVLAAGGGDITGALADIIAELGGFAIATTATADATTLELSADGTTVIITLAGTVADGVLPGGLFTPVATYTDTGGTGIDTGVTQTATGTWDGTAPGLSTLTTADTNGDGYIDRLVATFLENVDDTTIVAVNFSTSAGTVSGVVDDGASGDAVIWVNLTDGALLTDAIPTLDITAGGIEDVSGNPNVLISAFASTDAAGPVLVSASSSQPVSGLNLPNGTVLTLTFSEDINLNSTPALMSAADFKVEPDGATPTADLDGATATVALGGANNELDVTLTGPTTGGLWTAGGEIDLDAFTNVADNAAAPNNAVENGVLTEVPISGLPVLGAPTISYTLAIAYTNRIYVRFSELVRKQGGGDLSGTSWNYTGAASVSSVQPLNSVGDYCQEVFLIMSATITADEVFAPETITITTPVEDADGNLLSSTSHVVSDVGLGVIVPVWASNTDYTPGRAVGMIRDFDGTGYLEDKDMTLQATILEPTQTGATTYLYYDVNVPADRTNNGLWLPDVVAGLVPSANTDAREIDEDWAFNALRDYGIPASDPELVGGAEVEFILKAGSLYCARVTSTNDPRTAAPWSFGIRDIVTQRGGVTILNNVINPLREEKTTIRYTLPRSGMVTVQVFDLKSDIISVLHRGRQSEGTYTYTWDGKNRAGRPVARGIYFIRVVGPAINEYRKVLVVK